MITDLRFDPGSFKGLEYVGWQRGAASYDELFGSITRHAMDPLLDATEVKAGTRLLEMCCGLGYGCAAAVSRGACAVGIDFAPAMIDGARARFPGAMFKQGDAESLDFHSASFDAVICAFGVNHLPFPEKAISEAYRVLRRGGKFAFTMWCAPGKSMFHQLVLDAIRAYGTLDRPLPEAPPPFRFSEPEACTAALMQAGFVLPRITQVELAFRPNSPERVLDLTYSAVRLEMILSDQNAEARARIHEAIIAGANRFRVEGKIEIPMPAVLASATKAK
jgi:ubiquinone/menaquinone biosynthesis C-methylase UbiE